MMIPSQKKYKKIDNGDVEARNSERGRVMGHVSDKCQDLICPFPNNKKEDKESESPMPQIICVSHFWVLATDISE